VLVDGENGIIAGHGRVLAAKKLNLDEVPTIELKHLTKTQKKAYILADNRLALNSGWDNDLLALELGELSDDGFDLDLLGFDDTELSLLDDTEQTEGLTDEDAVPEVPDDPITKLGDVWLCGNHRVMCGDSTSIDAVDKLMDGNKADMVFTDPPYGISVKNTAGKIKNDDCLNVYRDSLPIFKLFLNDKSHAYFFFGSKLCMETLEILKENFIQTNLLIMPITNQTQPYPEGYFSSNYEMCFFTNYNGVRTHNSGVLEVSETTKKDKRYDGDGFLKKYYALSNDPITECNNKMVHPTQKKVDSVCFYIEISSNIKDIIIDLFGGSGTTLIACEKTNRINYSMELDPKYCDVIIKRWQDFTGKQAILESTGETYGSHT
jgi:DNA modification methylase